MDTKKKFGALSAVTTAVILVLVVAVNIALGLLGDRMSLRWDLTQSKAFEVSDEIAAVFERIDTPVQVTVLYDESEFQKTGIYFAQAYSVLKKAESLNPNITLRFVDPIANPDIKSQYPDLSLGQGNIVMTNQQSNASLEVKLEDLYVLDGNTIVESRAESVIASNLVTITAGNFVGAAFSSGHGEAEVPELESLLALNNYVVSHVNTMTADIDASVDALVIVSPATDYSEDEIKKLEQFLFNGGEYGKSIFYFANVEQSSLPNLEGFLGNYGVSPRAAQIYERDENRYLGADEGFAIAAYLEDIYSQKAQSRSLPAVTPYTRPVDILFESSGNTSVAPLLGYSDKAYAKPTDAPAGWSVDDAQPGDALYGAAMATVKGGSPDQKGYVAVFGSAYMIADALLTEQSFGNAEYLLGVFDGVTDNAFSIETAPKSLTGAQMSLTAANTKTLGFLFIGVVPAIIVVMGIVVYFRRRNK